MKKLWNEIEDIDRQIAAMVERRNALADKAASAVKARQDGRIVRAREDLDAVFARAKTDAAWPTNAIVACAGADGSYAQQAAVRMFGNPTVLYFKGFESVFEAVEKGACPYGVLPVENSSAGSVAVVYDLMQKHRFHIVRALKLKVDHVLMACPGARLDGIAEVASHPHALAQCTAFLKAHPQMAALPESNTAMAARQLAVSGRTDRAVIASRTCAEIYGLDVLAADISDTPNNYTRFICISRNLEIRPDANKFGVMLSLPHRPGSLSEVIAKFAAVGVNLTKLESRPVLGSDFEFRFIFEFESSADNPSVHKLLAELAANPEIESFTFLGAYEEC